MTEEIEKLSTTNQQLIQNLHTKTFFEKYHEVLEELNQLKMEQEMLVDFKFKEVKDQQTRVVPSLSVASINKPFVDFSARCQSVLR